MNLSNEQIINVVNGATRIETNELGVEFHRFSRTQESYFYQYHPLYCKESFFNYYFGKICRTSGGISLDFVTDAKIIKYSFGKIEYPCDAKPGWFDLYIDGIYTKSFTAEVNVEYIADGKEHEYAFYFPVYNFAIVSGIELDGASVFKPIKKEVKILFFGDSITHGGNAEHPSNTYVNRVARQLNVGIINQGQSGFVYDENVVENVCNPEIIVTAYGINDVFRKTTDMLYDDTSKFLKKVRKLYPNSKIVSILPLWTKWDGEDKNFKKEEKAQLKKAYDEFSDVVINGHELVPNETKYFQDEAVHPNDEGFEYYANFLCEYLTPLIVR